MNFKHIISSVVDFVLYKIDKLKVKKIIRLIAMCDKDNNYEKLLPHIECFHKHLDIMKEVNIRTYIREFYFANAKAVEEVTVQRTMLEYAANHKLANLPRGLYLHKKFSRVEDQTIEYMIAHPELHIYLWRFLKDIEEGNINYWNKLKNKKWENTKALKKSESTYLEYFSEFFGC